LHANYAQAGQENFGVRASTDGGITWTSIYDHDAPTLNWGRNAVVLSDYAGESSVWLAFEYQDGNNWSYGVGLDNIIIQEPVARDIEVSFIDNIYSVLGAPGETASFDFELVNLGTDDITSAHVVIESDGEVFEKTVETSMAFGEKATVSMDVAEGFHTEATAQVQHFNDEANDDEPIEIAIAAVTPIPNFTATDISGEDISLHTLISRNHVVTLDYFASWCGPCETSTPELNSAWVDMGSGTKGFDVLGLTVEATDDASVVSNLGWGAEYNKFAYSFENEVMWRVFNDEYGSGGIPMFIQICPDAENPGFSNVNYSSVGWEGGPALTAAAQQCDATVGTDDFSETGEASGIEDITTLSQLKVFPNPVDASSNIFFSLEEEEVVIVSITNMVGKTVFARNMGTQSGDVQVSLGDVDFANGVYTVNVQIGSEIASTKINVLR